MDTKQRRSAAPPRKDNPSGTRSQQSQKNSRAGTASASSRRQTGTQTPQRRRQSAQTSNTRRRQTAPKAAPTRTRQTRPAPDVVYTPPKPFSRNRLLLRLATMVAVVLAFTFGISIFFKVKTITVSGAEKYTAWQVREASGIEEGANLLSYGKIRAIANIQSELPYVDKVQIGIKLPDTVNIEIVEFDVVYSIKAQDESWWLITASREVVEQTNSATAGDYTKILGVQLGSPASGQQVSAYEAPVADTAMDGITTPVTVKASEKLTAALSILQYLEANGIIGKVASVDVTDISDIELWYGTQYQVKLGDTTQLSYKISSMAGAVSQLDSYHSGVLDVSFTFWENEVGYTPFS